MGFRIEKKEECNCVFVSGKLDLITNNRFTNAMSELVNSIEANNEKKGVIFDFSELTYLDSSGLGALISIKQIFDNMSIKIAFCNIPAEFEMLLKISGVDHLFEICEDEANAKKKVFS